MAFGLFKKKEVADIIFTGGKIFTQDPELPWAEAVACKDGIITAVGDYDQISGLEGADTEVVDLEGDYMLPGFINAFTHPVKSAFDNACLKLLNSMSLEEVTASLEDYVDSHPKTTSYFGYGYNGQIVKDSDPEEMRDVLNQVCEEKPVVLLSSCGFYIWANSAALDQVREIAATEQVATITLPYMLHVLSPINFERILENIVFTAAKYCEKGFTTVFDSGAPDYLDSVYQDLLVNMYQEDHLKQRFYGSLLISKDMDPVTVSNKLLQKKTNCMEMEEYLNFNTLKILVNSIDESQGVSTDVLLALCNEANDRCFDVHISAIGKEAVLQSFSALEAARKTGARKNTFVIFHDEEITEEDLYDFSVTRYVHQVPLALSGHDDLHYCLLGAKSVTEVIDRLTTDAANYLGLGEKLGSITRGKFADFAIFGQNPFDAESVDAFRQMNCTMTIMSGQIVYDAAEDTAVSWFDTLTSDAFTEE